MRLMYMIRNDFEETQIMTALKPVNIEFLYQTEKHSNNIDDLIKNSLASVRLRTAVAAHAAQKLDWNISFTGRKKNKPTDFLIVGKVSPNLCNQWLRKIQEVKKIDGQIVIDYTDHHIDCNSPIGEFYRNAILLANLVICSSSILQKNISKYSPVKTVVIEEPVEVPTYQPVNKKNNTTTVLWFGHASNLSYLIECLIECFMNGNNAKIILMTNICPLPDNYVKLLEVPQLENIEIHVVPWTKEDMQKASQMCDFCIIPTGYKDERKRGASANRLLTSLAMGLPTLTDQLDAYKPFSKYFKKMDRKSIQGMLANPLVEFELINEAQKIINERYASKVIMNKWESVLLDLNESRFLPKKTQQPIKLNLGCGDKIISGYINVDIVAARAGKQPDVICDLHDLKVFESNSVDEILAVHVVEHFWQWEATDILKEWTRVLKPGGKMILECPNLISAAQEFLKNPDISALGGNEGQRSMWVFYGDPAWRDPLMIHRWGYTPKSLATLMNSAGLTHLRQEPAQFKLREPRDMRITGMKPLPQESEN